MEFIEYVAENRRRLLRFATVLTGQPWLADEVVSDVLSRAFEQWSRISATKYPHAYVRRMVVNEFLSWKRRHALANVELVPDDSMPVTPDHSVDVADRDAMLRRLAELPRRQRAAVVLRYYIGLPDFEIAEQLGCRQATVRSNIARAMATLRLQQPQSESDHLYLRRSPS